MKTGTVIAIAAVMFGLGLAVGSLFGGGGSAEAEKAPSEVIAERDSLRTEVARLREEATDRTDRSISKRPDAMAVAGSVSPGGATAEVTDASGAQEQEGEAPSEKGEPRFFAESHGGILRKIDWKKVGSSLEEMVPLIVEVAGKVQAGETPNPETIGRIGELNGSLLTAALTVESALPGRNIQSRFTSPFVMANAIGSTLEAAVLPLSEGQSKSLLNIAERSVAEDDRRIGGYSEETLTLVKLYEEAELRDRFFADAFALLTPEQLQTLSPEEIHGRLRLSVFSSAVLYAPRTGIRFFEDRDALTTLMLGRAMGLGFTDEQREAARGIIAEWVDGLPVELVEQKFDDLDAKGLIHSTRATAWAKEMAKLLGLLTSRLTLDDDALARARGVGSVIVPLFRPEGG